MVQFNLPGGADVETTQNHSSTNNVTDMNNATIGIESKYGNDSNPQLKLIQQLLENVTTLLESALK